MSSESLTETCNKPGDEQIIKGLNLRIQPRKMTAIVGDSGAGKSTLVKLITRLFDPSDGQVLLDGVAPNRKLT
jgi:ABC-type multidrug transport system fused ATPase/permease subunit